MITGTTGDGIPDNVDKVAEEENLEAAAQFLASVYEDLPGPEFTFSQHYVITSSSTADIPVFRNPEDCGDYRSVSTILKQSQKCLIPKTWLLLDNQAAVNIFSKPALVKNI